MNTFPRVTTDLNILRNQPRLFTWGPITHISDIGPYTIAEYTVDRGKADERTSYHIWVHGKDTSRGAATLDGALLVAIAFKNLDYSSRTDHMAEAAAKLLNVPQE